MNTDKNAILRSLSPSPQDVETARKFAFEQGHRATIDPKIAANLSQDVRMRAPGRDLQLGRFFGQGVSSFAGTSQQTLKAYGLGAPPTDPGAIRAYGKEQGPYGMGSCDTNTAMARALKAVTSCGFMAQPVIEYVRQTVSLPQTNANVLASFGDPIDVFNPTTPPGAIQSTSFLGRNGTLQVDMFAAGIGLHVYAGPVSFAIPGNAVATSVTSPIYSPDVWTYNDLVNGLLGPSATSIGTVIPAVLEFGGVVHEMLWYMSQAYRVRLYMNQKFIVLDEPMGDFAYFTSYGSGEMAGTSERAIQPYVAQVNANYRALGATSIFQPVNARRIGSVTIPGPTNQGVFHPTRDYDFADVTYGGMSFQQGGCCKPYHQFQSPVLFDRGISITLLMEVCDTYSFLQMQNLLSINHNINGSTPNVQMDSTVNGFTNGGASSALPAGRELTLDQGSNAYASQSVDTDRYEFEGGVFEMFAGLRGQEFWGDWKDQLKAAAKAGLIQAPTVTGSWYGGQVGGQMAA